MVSSLEQLTPLQLEHFEVARSFGKTFTFSEFVERYRMLFPERTTGSIIPNDYAFNNGNDLSYREKYPWFLEKVGRGQFRFIGLEKGEQRKIGNIGPDGSAYWWVNNKQTYVHEVGGNYLWSPTSRSDGARNEFYENMKRVRPGDTIFAFADAEIKAVGICSAPAILSAKPNEFGTSGKAWNEEGWRIPVAFTRLSQPLRPKSHMDILAYLLPKKYSPIKPDGNGNQGAYLAAVPYKMAEALIELLGECWAEVDRATVDPIRQMEVAEESEDEVEKELRNRTDLTKVEADRLIKSRLGQGVYRDNLVLFEDKCRLTGVTNLQDLRASHIKPWRYSTNFEKLDGNNGLLLSPHVDHLFDRGFISFLDDGTLLVSPQANDATFSCWGIPLEGNYGPFRAEQFPYLAFHRQFVFRP